jgi:hypothetical protein
VDFQHVIPGNNDISPVNGDDDQMVFLTQTKIKTRFGCCDGVLTLEKGSALEFVCTRKKINIKGIKGGHLLIENGKRMIEMTSSRLLVELEKSPGEIIPMSVSVHLPTGLQKGDQYCLSISQKDENKKTVGGADTVYRLV